MEAAILYLGAVVTGGLLVALGIVLTKWKRV
jgi:outer membrane murein-binding lipoprotein Lpp